MAGREAQDLTVFAFSSDKLPEGIVKVYREVTDSRVEKPENAEKDWKAPKVTIPVLQASNMEGAYRLGKLIDEANEESDGTFILGSFNSTLADRPIYAALKAGKPLEIDNAWAAVPTAPSVRTTDPMDAAKAAVAALFTSMDARVFNTKVQKLAQTGAWIEALSAINALAEKAEQK